MTYKPNMTKRTGWISLTDSDFLTYTNVKSHCSFLLISALQVRSKGCHHLSLEGIFQSLPLDLLVCAVNKHCRRPLYAMQPANTFCCGTPPQHTTVLRQAARPPALCIYQLYFKRTLGFLPCFLTTSMLKHASLRLGQAQRAPPSLDILGVYLATLGFIFTCSSTYFLFLQRIELDFQQQSTHQFH